MRAQRDETVDPNQELRALGAANLAAGLFQGCGGAALRPRPVAGIGPAAIDGNQHRPGSGHPVIGVQDRPCKAQDQCADGQRPQQKQPPGRLVGLGLVVLQAQKQRHARKPPPDRRGRHGAQQKPKDRQRDKRHQKPGHRETKRAERDHQCPPSSAA